MSVHRETKKNSATMPKTILPSLQRAVTTQDYYSKQTNASNVVQNNVHKKALTDIVVVINRNN